MTMNEAWTSLLDFATDGKVTMYNHSNPEKFPNGMTVNYRIRAKNGVGFGEWSYATEVLCDSTPNTMHTPEVDKDNNMINPYWIYITWPSLTNPDDTGRDDIIKYGLEWDQGSGNFVLLIKDFVNAYNLSSPDGLPFPSGMAMDFVLFAENGVGEGEYSPSYLTVIADEVPLHMVAPTTTSIDYNSIKLTWDPISDWADTGGDDIIYYKVEFLDKTCYLDDVNSCEGEEGTWLELTKESTQLAQTTYEHVSPTHFSRFRLFEYRICAKNKVGMGACSVENLKITTDNCPLAATTIKSEDFTVLYNKITLVFQTYNDDESELSGKSPVTGYEF